MSEPDNHPEEESKLANELEEPGEKALLDELLGDSTRADAPNRAPSANVGPITRIGRIVEWTSGQAPKIEYEGNDRGPLAARSTVALDPTIIFDAIAMQRGVVLLFEDGRPDAPIITGLLQDFGADVDEAHERAPAAWEDNPPDPSEEAEDAEQGTNIAEVDARVDGKRIELEAADEIVLRCGQACIVLRRNGRVVIRGTYVETRSRGVNRIKGGSVEIN